MMLSICKVEVGNLDMKYISQVVGIKGWHMGSNDHFVDILSVYSSVYNRIGIPIHTIPSPGLLSTDGFSFDL